MKLSDALRGVSRLAIDTPVFIYFVEKYPTYLARVREVIRLVDEGVMEAGSSVLALTEVLTVPLCAGDMVTVADYKELLLHGRNFRLIDIDTAIAERAAELRARHGLKTADSLYIACALADGSDAFLTNDTGLRRVTELPVIILDDLTL